MSPEERSAAIEQRKTSTGRTSRQWVQGAFTDFEIWRVPVDLLVLNAGNRRFHAEKLEWEEQLGRALEPQNREQDQRSIISILLDEAQRISDDEITGKPSKDAVALMADWQQRGQEQPLWIRPDGFVVNGNRRLAALRRLAGSHGTATGTFSYVEAIVLGADIDDDEMFQMEAREQLTEGYKVRYGDLNVLLTLREAAVRENVDWTDDESIRAVGGRIQDLVGNNASYAEIQLRTIRYMDEYLEYTSEPGLYQRMLGQVERFRDIGKNMGIMAREYPERALDLLEAQFHAVQAGLNHLQIRDLRKLAVEDPEAFDHVVEEVKDLVTSAPPSPPEPAPPFDDDDEDPDTDEQEMPVSTPTDFPRRDVKRSFEIAIENRNAKQRNDAEASLREAAGRLAQVTPELLVELVATGKPAIGEAIEEIREWVRRADGIGG